MTIDNKIELVKGDILKRFPKCHYTIRILMWDDGTDSVECRHGSNEMIHISKYYDNKLEYYEDEYISSAVKTDAEGNERYVIK